MKKEEDKKDENQDEVREEIRSAGNKGKVGDGKIFMTRLEKVIRIRTGETGGEAV